MKYINDVWNPWTIKSANIPFKSSEKAIGDGEHKLGSEFNQKPLGQNFPYDLDIENEKWEIKKLDSDNSFRLGVDVASRYNPLISTVIRIFEKILSIKYSLIDSETEKVIKQCINKIESTNGRCSTGLLDGLKKNEVAESNLKIANEIIEILKSILFKEESVISLYSSIDGKKNDYNILVAFQKVKIENISLNEKIKILGGNDIYNRLLITNLIFEDIAIFDGTSLRNELNKIIRSVFQNIKLVLVHEENGYKPINNLESIYCNRITSGLPRCKIQ